MRTRAILCLIVWTLPIFASAHQHGIGAEVCDHALTGGLRYVKSQINWNEIHLNQHTQPLRELFEKSSESPLWQEWAKAAAKLKVLNELMFTEGSERAYFANIYQAAYAAVTKHQLEFGKNHHLHNLDVPRHMAILRAISETDPTRLKFSAYKIKRAIEGRHSLREYLDCKESGR